MQKFDLNEHPHTRKNLLTGDWILVSPHRTKRPWQGKVEEVPPDDRPSYDPKCYLCPRNTRADGSVNPDYEDSFVFTNDFSALLQDTPQGNFDVRGMLQAESEKGICRVVSFSPDHSLTLPEMTLAAIHKVVQVWCDEFRNLSNNPIIRHIQIFENKGEMMGCSNPHPHGQIWSQHSLPLEIVKETNRQRQYFNEKKKSLLTDYLEIELQEQKRIVIENDHFVALVPFWAVWPYETIIISRRHVRTIGELTEEEQMGFADIIRRLTIRYDNIFKVSFPYSAGIHQSPVNDGEHPEWHLHMHFYPPLLRSATVKKFMVGYEMLANPQRDITPEQTAEKLQQMSEVHYKATKR